MNIYEVRYPGWCIDRTTTDTSHIVAESIVEAMDKMISKGLVLKTDEIIDIQLVIKDVLI